MSIQFKNWFISIFLVSVVVLGGCATQDAGSISSDPAQAQTTTKPATQAENGQYSNLPRLEGKATVVMVVNGQPITMEIDGTNAPISAGNFVDLVERGVYNGLVFHRVVREPEPFVVQGGDPQGNGSGSFIDPATSQPRYIPLEITPKGQDKPIYGKTFKEAKVQAPPLLAHTRGAVAMARSALPNSASSQFYITLADLPFLNGDYAVFGYVTEGMDTVDKIKQGDRIESAKVTEGLENLKK